MFGQLQMNLFTTSVRMCLIRAMISANLLKRGLMVQALFKFKSLFQNTETLKKINFLRGDFCFLHLFERVTKF